MNRRERIKEHFWKYGERYKIGAVIVVIIIVAWYTRGYVSNEDCTSFDARGCLD